MTLLELRLHVASYVNLRRSLGFQTRTESHNLLELVDYVEAQSFSWPIRTQTVLDWIAAASAHCGIAGQHMRLIHARSFLTYLRACIPDTEVPGPRLLPGVPRPKPRLYSNEEIVKLQQATLQFWEPGSLCQLTPYTIIGLLCSTGIRAAEVMALRDDEVDLDSTPGKLYIAKTKFYKSRIVPLHPTTADQLRSYRQVRNQAWPHPSSRAFFLSGRGRPFSYPTLRRLFAQLIQFVGIQNAPGRRGPMLHSFRHTFAVNRLLSWYLNYAPNAVPSMVRTDSRNLMLS
jgi:integrase/recombinase XerD